MEGSERREKLIELLENSDQPLAGGRLAKRLGVSRQVIVQDIALLRAVNKNILATARGYVLQNEKESRIPRYYSTFYVKHHDEQIKDELYTIVDNGGKVLNIIVEHDVYGQISADLVLETRIDVDNFCIQLKNSKARPLNVVADGHHFHTVSATSEIILQNIERALKEKGYLITP